MKICLKCKEEKELSEFNKKVSTRDGLQSNCRTCQNAHARKYYAKNAVPLRKQSNNSRKVRVGGIKNRVYELLLNSKCTDCNTSYHPFAMQFDHRDPSTKIDSVSELMSAGASWTRIEEEMKKCDIRCANCHFIRTGTSQGWYSSVLNKAA